MEVDPDLEADPSVLSLHLLLADEHARAHRYALLGAERATARFSHADAARLYRRAIDAGRTAGMLADPRRAPAIANAWEQLGEALRCTGKPAAAARALTMARRLLGDDPVAQARLSHRHAQVAERRETLTAAVRWLKRGLRRLDGVESDEATRWRARLRSYLGGVRNRQGRFQESVGHCRQAIVEAESVGELAALARACYSLDWALFELGRTDEVVHSGRALEIYEELGDPEHEATVLHNLGMFAHYEGRWDEAVELYQRSALSSERAGRPGDVVYTDCNIGEILSDQGRFEEAAVHLRRASRVGAAIGDSQSVAFVDVLLGRLAVRDGRYAEGLTMLERAVTALSRFRMDADAHFARAVIAEATALGGDPARALELASRELETGEKQLPLLLRAAGIAHARLGRPQDSRRVLADALAAAREREAPYELAATIEALAALGSGTDELIEEQRALLGRLKVERLPSPQLA